MVVHRLTAIFLGVHAVFTLPLSSLLPSAASGLDGLSRQSSMIVINIKSPMKLTELSQFLYSASSSKTHKLQSIVAMQLTRFELVAEWH